MLRLGTHARVASRADAALVIAIVSLFVVRALVAALTDLTEDEAYYRLWGLAPAMSYLDHPPMVGWMIAAGRFIAGDNPLGIRLAAVLTALLGPLVLWRTGLILFGEVVARRAVWFALAMPLLAVGGIIITPDTPSALFWGLAAWAVAELYVSRDANWWLAVGIFSGLGLLSKYTNLFAGVGIALWLLALRENRHWFGAWQLWAGGVLAAVIAFPVVLWNASHGWASFAKQFGRVARGQEITAVYLGELFGAFIGLASPIIAVLGVLGLVQVTRAAFFRRDQRCILVVASMLPLLVYFLMHAFHSRVQPNWLAPLYPSFAICAAIAVDALAKGKRGEWAPGGWSSWAAGLGFLMSGLVYVHALYPLVLLPGSKDPTSQMRGWKELAAEVDRKRTANGACWVATSNYATTGQLAYHLAGRAPVAQLNERVRYINLPPVDPATLKCPALYVELVRRASPALLAERFRAVTPLGMLTRNYRDKAIADYAIFRVAEPVDAVLAD